MKTKLIILLLRSCACSSVRRMSTLYRGRPVLLNSSTSLTGMVGSIYYPNTQAIGTKRSMFKVIFSCMVTQRPSWGMYLSLDFFLSVK